MFQEEKCLKNFKRTQCLDIGMQIISVILYPHVNMLPHTSFCSILYMVSKKYNLNIFKSGRSVCVKSVVVKNF